MKIELIAPGKTLEQGHDFWDMKITSAFAGRKYGQVPLALSTVAALTPPDVEVSITDENIESIDFDKEVDMVGITFNTPLAPRAYEIADKFRENGVTVVMGGIHASVLPEEAVQHADAVVIGEAEDVWQELIHDFQEGRLKRFYSSTERPDLKNSPVPRWDLLKTDLYNCHTIQAGRGCPFDCEFCSVRAFSGAKYRFKPLENVIEEINVLRQMEPKKMIVFVDDNIASNHKHLKALLKALIPLNIYWFGQASVNVAKDEELLELMAESGCKQVLVGFESLSTKNLKLMNKARLNRVDDYVDIIEKLHAYGISVFGTFILGSDFDDEMVFERIVQFVNDANIEFVQVSILTPFPGTLLFQRLEREGRLLHKDWEKYTGASVCFTPKLMSPQTLQDGFYWVWQEICSYDALYKRLSNLWNKSVLARGKRTASPLVRTLLALKGFQILDAEGVRFLLKSLWHPKSPYLSFILTSIDLNDCAFSFPKAKYFPTHIGEEVVQ